MAFCKKCGAQLPENGKFCVQCGAPVETDEEKPQAEEQPVMQEEQATADNQEAETASNEQEAGTTPENGKDAAPDQEMYTAPEQEPFAGQNQQGQFSGQPLQGQFSGPQDQNQYAGQQNQFSGTQQNQFSGAQQYGQGVYAAPQGGNNVNKKPPVNPEEQKKKNKKILTIAIAAVVAVIVIAVAAVVVVNIVKKNAKKRKTINISEYINVEFDGYDTMGTATVEIDEDKFVDKAIYAMKASKDNKKAIEKAEDLYYSISVYADETSDLSNGDTITITADWNRKLVAKYGVILKFKEYETEVSGLSEIKVVDPFEFADVEFSGVDGNVTVQITNTSDKEGLDSIYFSSDKNYDLRKGDKVKISASYSEYSLLHDYGIKLDPVEKEYTVDSVDTYDVDAKNIKQDFLDSFEQDALDKINDDYTYSSYIISDVKYFGYYLLTANNGSTTPESVLFVVYKGNAKGRNEDVQKEVFLPVEYDGIIEKTDGTVYSEDDYGNLWGYSNGISGYVSEKKMYDDIVGDNSTAYDVVLNGGLRDYSEMKVKADGSNCVELPYNYHTYETLGELSDCGVFENITEFNIADYVSSDEISDDEDYIEMMNTLLKTLSKNNDAQTDSVGPIPVDASITWFYFEEADGLDYRLVFGSGTAAPASGETTAAAETTGAADATAAETAAETQASGETNAQPETVEETTAA